MNDRYPFVNEPLPYPYEALEPHISAETLHFHHDKHLQSYIDKLNTLLSKYPPLQRLTLWELLHIQPRTMPQSDVIALMRNAGGVFNHRLYFDSMSPDSTGLPRGSFAARIALSFGCFEKFREKFSKAAAEVFGSGYAWLCEDGAGRLFIAISANQNLPEGKPLLCIDVWEHAYYLDYQNRRDDYIEAWWKVADLAAAAGRSKFSV